MEKLQKVFEVIVSSGCYLVMEHNNSEPFFTTDIDRASKYPPQGDWEERSVAEDTVDLIETKGYTMPLTIKTLKVSYQIIDLA